MFLLLISFSEIKIGGIVNIVLSQSDISGCFYLSIYNISDIWAQLFLIFCFILSKNQLLFSWLLGFLSDGFCYLILKSFLRCRLILFANLIYKGV